MRITHGDGPFNSEKPMANEYLMKEYELCFQQLRFYDTRHNELSKYLFTLTSAVATAQFAVFKFLQSATPEFFAFQAVLSVVVFIASALLYLGMLQNRLYFVFMAKQINAIRGYLMTKDAAEFKSNQLYTCIDFPAFRLRSIHTIHLVGATLISSLFASMSVYGIVSALSYSHPIFLAFLSFVVTMIIEVVFGTAYLTLMGNKGANEFLKSK